MKYLFVFICCFGHLFLSCQSHSQEKEGDQSSNDRQPVVAGQFYPGSTEELKATLQDFFSQARKRQPEKEVSALVSPHAGYVYSGVVAASAYNQVDPNRRFDNIFILAPSHQARFEGASIYNRGDYITPLGKVQVNRELASRLISENEFFVFNESAHSKEHSLEVQLPFLQHHLKKDFQIVPVVTGTHDQQTIKKIAGALEPYLNSRNLFVVSTDFSHYPGYDDAVKVDEATGEAITKNAPDNLLQTLRLNAQGDIQNLATSMCGWPGMLTLLHITSTQNNIQVNKIHYRNSGDATGKKDRVVGYWALSFVRNKNQTQHTMSFELTEEEKKKLLNIARQTLEGTIRNDHVPEVSEEDLSETLKKQTGAFVTLQKDGELRGCIGRFEANMPLYKVVEQMAIAAATKDMRFSTVTEDELDEITIEISVLTPMEKVESIDEIVPGTHGIYIKKGSKAGTLLPQVAVKTGWSKEEFLGHCARDKAGIGWDGWKDAEVYTYRAIVFGEKELSG